MKKLLSVLVILAVILITTAPAGAVDPQVFQDGADRLVETQNIDGGWAWSLGTTTSRNVLAPTGMGLAQAYLTTGDPAHLAALVNAGGLLVAGTNNFSSQDAYFAAQLDEIIGGTTYKDHMATNWYGPLAAGEYDRNGADTNYDTQGLIDFYVGVRTGQGFQNLLGWDIGAALAGAVANGIDGDEIDIWKAGTETAVAGFVSEGSYEILGLAGAIYGLSCAYPSDPPTTDLDLVALADQLAALQITGEVPPDDIYNGSFGGSTQNTAFAIIAMTSVDSKRYANQINDAANWIIGLQSESGTGGWVYGPTYGEYNEVTGEALWALQQVNLAPTADAGPDQEVTNNQVALDGSGSYDLDGTIESYDWALRYSIFNFRIPANDKTDEGETVTVTGLQKGIYNATLTVTDDEGLTDTDTMTVTNCFISTLK